MAGYRVNFTFASYVQDTFWSQVNADYGSTDTSCSEKTEHTYTLNG